MFGHKTRAIAVKRAKQAVKFQYFTDVEGNWEYFKKQIDNSQVVRFNADRTGLEFIDDNPSVKLIFGGDVCDKGTGSIRIIKMLQELKEQHSDKVILIAGNRDINKTRLFELPLSPEHVFDPDVETTTPYFVKAEAGFTPYCEGLRSKAKRLVSAESLIDEELITRMNQALGLSLNERFQCSTAEELLTILDSDELRVAMNNPINRLKWILSTTMAAPNAFEYCRQELAEIEQRTVMSVTDTDVYRQLRGSVEESGQLRKYLMQTQLIASVGDSLIVHGAINDDNVGKVPKGEFGDQVTYDNLDEWVAELNRWWAERIEHWDKSRYEESTGEKQYSYNNEFDGSMPMAYIRLKKGSPFAETNVTVTGMSGRASRELLPMSSQLAQQLTQQGYHRIIVGHKPIGDVPAYLVGSREGISTDAEKNVEYLCADTLLGHRDACDPDLGSSIRNSLDSRGESFPMIHGVFDPEQELSQIHVHGTDRNGAAYDLQMQNRWEGNTDAFDPYIGRIVELESKKHLVRINTDAAQQRYVLSCTEGRNITYKEVSRSFLETLDPSVFLSQSSEAQPSAALDCDATRHTPMGAIWFT